MKRELGEQDSMFNILGPKRPRLEEDNEGGGEDLHSLFDSQTFIRYPSDLLEQGTDGTGYIDAVVRMVWDRTTAECVCVNVIDRTGAFVRFDIHFMKPSFARLSLATQDTFKLSLRGCEIQHIPPSSVIASVPIVLKYTQSALFKFRIRNKKPVPEAESLVEEGEKVRTNTVKKEDDDWFRTPFPEERPRHHASLAPPLTVHTHMVPILGEKEIQEPNAVSSLPSPPSPPTQALDNRSTPVHSKEKRSPERDPLQESSRGEKQTQAETGTKRAKRNKRAKEKKAIRASSTPSAEQVTGQPDPPKTPTQEEPDSTSNTHSSALEELNATVKGAYGQREPKEEYTPITHVMGPDFKNQNLNLIGVVRDIGSVSFIPKRSQWKCFVRIVDQSSRDDIFPEKEGLQVNLFVKTSEAFLPSPQPGDIIVFRHLSSSKWNGASEATGASDIFQWLVFSPSSGTFKHNGNEMDPQSVNNSPPRSPMPLWRPRDEQLEPLSAYCIKLVDWWTAVQHQREKAASNTTVHYLGEGDALSSQPQKRRQSHPLRQHRLIRDCTPDMQPNGYFNCTLQILRVREYAGFGPITVIATDYTRPQNATNYDLDWCQSNLKPYLFSVDIWNDGANKAREMKAGEIYRFNNARMEASKFKYWQASVRENKFVHLRETDEMKDQEFQEFLKRRTEWEKKNSTTAPHGLLSDIRNGGVVTCTVQLIHRQRAATSTELFVTDYTTSGAFCSRPPGASWAAKLDKWVFKVSCRGGIERQAETIPVGSLCLLKNVIIKQTNTDRKLFGELGGEEMLISTANENAEQTIALSARREEWEKLVRTPSALVVPGLEGGVSIAKILEARNVSRHQTIARITSYYPSDLEDGVSVLCRSCDKKLPSRHKSCLNCEDDDMLDHYFFLMVEIEDRTGKSLTLHIGNPSHTKHPFSDLNPRKFWECSRSLEEPLSPFIGNIPKIYANEMNAGPLSTPFVKFTIDSRPVPGQKNKMIHTLHHWEQLQ